MRRTLELTLSIAVATCLNSGCGTRALGLKVYGDPDAIGARVIIDGEAVAVLKPMVEDYEFGSPPELHDCYGPDGVIAAPGVPRVNQSLKVSPGLREVVVIGQRGDSLRGSVEMYDSPVMFIFMKCKKLSLRG